MDFLPLPLPLVLVFGSGSSFGAGGGGSGDGNVPSTGGGGGGGGGPGEGTGEGAGTANTSVFSSVEIGGGSGLGSLGGGGGGGDGITGAGGVALGGACCVRAGGLTSTDGGGATGGGVAETEMEVAGRGTSRPVLLVGLGEGTNTGSTVRFSTLSCVTGSSFFSIVSSGLDFLADPRSSTVNDVESLFLFVDSPSDFLRGVPKVSWGSLAKSRSAEVRLNASKVSLS